MTQSKSGGYLASWLSMHGHQAELQVMVIKPKKCTMSTRELLYQWNDIVQNIAVNIECFHARGQHLCKFIGTKESVCIRKEVNSQRTGLGHQHGRRFMFWDTNMAVVTSCENTLYGSNQSTCEPASTDMTMHRCHDLLWLRN